MLTIWEEFAPGFSILEKKTLFLEGENLGKQWKKFFGHNFWFRSPNVFIFSLLSKFWWVLSRDTHHDHVVTHFECGQMAQNGPRMTQNDPKWPKNDPKWPTITPNGPKITPRFTHFLWANLSLSRARSELRDWLTRPLLGSPRRGSVATLYAPLYLTE